MSSAKTTETRQQPGTETGWHQLSMWAALPIALQLLRPRVLGTLLPALFATVLVLREVLADGRWSVAAAVLVPTGLVLGAWTGWALAWRQRFRYRIDGEGITVRTGVVYRSEVRLGWERVRNVDVRQAFYFRPMDRVTLVLEGTGGSDEVVAIPAVTRDLAEDVRRRAVAVPTVDTTGPPASEGVATEAASGVLHQPSPAALLLHGAINGRAFALLLAGLGVLYSVLNPFIEEADLVLGATERVLDQGVDSMTGWLLFGLPILVVASILLVVISAVAALVLYWNYALSVEGDRYRFSHGLVETQERSLRAAKLQGLTTVETAVGRLLGRSHLLVHKATSAEDSDGDQSDGSLLVPALSRDEAAALVRLLDPAGSPRPDLQPIETAYRRFWQQRLLAAVAAVALAAGAAELVLGDANSTLLVLLAVVAVAAATLTTVLVGTAWRNWGWTLDGTVLFITYGVLGRHHQVFHLDRIQHVAITRSPYQRRHGLATIQLALPDGDRTIPFLDDATAVQLANLSIFEVETAPHLEL